MPFWTKSQYHNKYQRHNGPTCCHSCYLDTCPDTFPVCQYEVLMLAEKMEHISRSHWHRITCIHRCILTNVSWVNDDHSSFLFWSPLLFHFSLWISCPCNTNSDSLISKSVGEEPAATGRKGEVLTLVIFFRQKTLSQCLYPGNGKLRWHLSCCPSKQIHTPLG